MCEHSPLSADDCKPNKALRLTVKAFLKSEEKKRDKGKNGINASKDAQQEQAVPKVVSGEGSAPNGEKPAKGDVEGKALSSNGDQSKESEITANPSKTSQVQGNVSNFLELRHLFIYIPITFLER